MSDPEGEWETLPLHLQAWLMAMYAGMIWASIDAGQQGGLIEGFAMLIFLGTIINLAWHLYHLHGGISDS
jgi:hypothetical protein